MQLKYLAGFSLVFVLIYNLLFFQTQGGVGLALQYLLLQVFLYGTRDKSSQNLDYALLTSSVAIFFALLSAYRANEVVLSINHLLALFFSTATLFFYKYQPRFHLTIPGFLLIPATSFISSLTGVTSLIGGRQEDLKSSKESELTSSIVRGGLIALFFCGALFLLLMKADFIFAKLINNFFANIWERLFISALVFITLISFGLTKIKQHLYKIEEKIGAVVNKGKIYELSIILVSVIVLFTIFITVQFRYLFLPVGEMELVEIGINSATYSEYVRAGFFELLTASVLVIGLISYCLKYLGHLLEKQKLVIQLLTAFLTLETFMILISAAKRLSFYAEAHGLTRAREFGFIFLIWISLVLLLLVLRVTNLTKKELHSKLILLITLLVFFSVNLFNLDKLIATKYYPTVNKEVDYLYLVNLSTDGFDSWIPAVNQAEKLFGEYKAIDQLTADENRKFILTKLSLEKLNSRNIYLQDKYGSLGDLEAKYINQEIPKDILIWRKWQSTNISEYLSYQHLIQNSQIFAKIPVLLDQVDQIEIKVTESVRNDTRLDRSTQAPLVID